MAEDKFYRVYSYQDELETGKCIKFRHEISFDESKADLTELVALSRSELESRKRAFAPDLSHGADTAGPKRAGRSDELPHDRRPCRKRTTCQG